MIQQLDQSNEEDDGGENRNYEILGREYRRARQERGSLICKSKKISSKFRDKSEYIIYGPVSLCCILRMISNQQPARDRSTKSATMNCTNIPTITVCHLIILLCFDVAHNTDRITTRPNKLTARLARVLSRLSGLAKAPINITPTTSNAPAGSLSFSGIKFATLTPVLFHIKCIGLVMTVMGR